MRSDVRSITDIWANHTVAMCNVTMDSVSDSERLCGQTRYFFLALIDHHSAFITLSTGAFSS